jgi:DNA repair exonuclease SbcCD ATPase subunit
MTIAKLKDQLGLSGKLKDPLGLAGKLKDQISLAVKPKGDEPPGPDERELKIEQLERAIDEEREHSTTLRKTIEELRFKAEILERSYSKQLDDARQRTQTAESALAELRAQLAEFQGADKDATQLLSEARAELAKVAAERDRLRKSISSGSSGLPEVTPAADSASALPKSDQMSIDELLEDALWAREQEKINQERRGIEPKASRAEESLIEEMIPADLVFSGKAADEEA